MTGAVTASRLSSLYVISSYLAKLKKGPSVVNSHNGIMITGHQTTNMITEALMGQNVGNAIKC